MKLYVPGRRLSLRLLDWIRVSAHCLGLTGCCEALSEGWLGPLRVSILHLQSSWPHAVFPWMCQRLWHGSNFQIWTPQLATSPRMPGTRLQGSVGTPSWAPLACPLVA